MAIYHFSEKNISRSDGRSAVACAAYRSGEKLIDHTYGKTQDYTKKNGVEYSCIYAPDNTNKKLLDRQNLWNAVEQAEFKKNGEIKLSARLAKEYEVALPHELTNEQRKNLIDDFCKKLVDKHGLIVDASIHAPHDDNLNCHAHIMFTTRKVNDKGELGAKAREFNDKGPQLLKNWRETFAIVTNDHLERAGLDVRIDHRSYKDQGRDYLEPTVHEGNEITALRRDGIDTEISLKNDKIIARNEELKEFEQIINGLDQEINLNRNTNHETLIADLENQLRLTQIEEQEILAELAKLDQFEQEQKQAQQVAEIDKAYDDFIDLQSRYAEFANNFYATGKAVNKRLEALDNNLIKSEKWLSKQKGFYLHQDGLFYDDYHHQPTNVNTPYYFTTSRQVDKDKDKLMKQYKLDIAKLSETFDIETVVKELHQNADKLTENGIELPVPEPTFMQKLKREYIHSYNTLNNFDADMKPVIDEYREDTEQAEQERISAYYAEKKREELEQKREAENRRRKAEYDLEVEKRIEARKRQEWLWTNEPKVEKKPSKDNDNDFSM
ncbi:MobQ family relaxase [Acinetobacter kookii]